MLNFGWFTLSVTLILGCTVQSSTSNHYLTAEKLWTEKNYPASVSEFDRVIKEAPNTAIGLQALWRASMTRALFLNESEEALKGFTLFLERASQSDLAPQAQLEIGEIYFSRLGQYQKAIDHYQALLGLKKFSQEEESRFVYRIGRSYLLTNRVKKATEWFEKGLRDYPDTPIAKKMKFDLASAWYALGETDKSAYAKALRFYSELKESTRSQDHRLYVQSVFGEAATLEEQDALDEAFALFDSIKNDYPAPNVIQVRMHRIAERKNKKRK